MSEAPIHRELSLDGQPYGEPTHLELLIGDQAISSVPFLHDSWQLNTESSPDERGQASPKNGATLPLQASGPMVAERVTEQDNPQPINWVEVSQHTEVDATLIPVTTHDVYQIIHDKYLTPQQRVSRLAHVAIGKFAQYAGIDEALVVTPAQLQADYFDLAVYVMTARKTNMEVEIVAELIDEGLLPYRRTSPLPLGERIVKILHTRPDATTSLTLLKLWMADEYGIDLPSSYETLRKAPKLPRRRYFNLPAPDVRYT